MDTDELRVRGQIACGIAHDQGAGMSIRQMFALVLEKGLPTPEERERLRAERAGDNTKP